MQRQWLIDDFTAITETIHGDNRENAGIESMEIPDAEVMAYEYITLAGTKVSGSLAPGLYLLRTTYSDGSTTTKKVAIK